MEVFEIGSLVNSIVNGHHPLLFVLFLLCVIFFIVFLTHMPNRLVSLTCTRYRSDADDSTLSYCCCRSMALLNFSTHIRLINQMLLRLVSFSLSLSLSTGKCLSINTDNMFFRLCIRTVYISD